jgi:hypothetical protein
LSQCVLHGDHLSKSTPLHEDAEIGEGWEAEGKDHSLIFIEIEVEEETTFNTQCGMYVFPPSCKDAAAAKKYHRHCVIPKTILQELEATKIT